jgi:hypothetical protein
MVRVYLINIINVFSVSWMFNIVLLDAAPFKRRSSMRQDVDKEKHDNLL